MTMSSKKYILNKLTEKNFKKLEILDRICGRYWRPSQSCGWNLERTNRPNVKRIENMESSRLNGMLGNLTTCRWQASMYYPETHHCFCNVSKIIHALGASFKMCMKRKTFLIDFTLRRKPQIYWDASKQETNNTRFKWKTLIS